MFTYLGNKRKLLDFIEEQVNHVKKKLKKDKLVTMDGFTGSGVVARMLSTHSSELHTNNDEGLISADKWKKMLEPYQYDRVKKEYKRMVDRNGEVGEVNEILYLIKK